MTIKNAILLSSVGTLFISFLIYLHNPTFPVPGKTSTFHLSIPPELPISDTLLIPSWGIWNESQSSVNRLFYCTITKSKNRETKPGQEEAHGLVSFHYT